MAGRSEVTAMALALPGAVDESSAERLIFTVGQRGFAWSFMQRDTPKQARWPNIEVLAISCTLEHKEMLIEAAPDVFFDDAHYRGYPAVLVRLPVIASDELQHLLQQGHAMQASKPKRKKR